MKYRIGGKEKLASFGAWPVVSLKEARQKAEDAREKIRAGIDPVQEKKKLQEAARAEEQRQSLTFRVVASAWLETYKQGRAYKTWENARGRLANHVLPQIGDKTFLDLRRSDFAAVLSPLPCGTPKSTGFKVASLLKLIDDYGIDHHDLQANRAEGLTRNIKVSPEKVKHHAAITDQKTLAKWLPVVESFYNYGKADPLFRYAFKLLVLTGVRVNALLQAEWQEIDIANGVWHIPAEHEKDRKPLDLFLSVQAVEVFRELREYHRAVYGETPYCFPGHGKKSKVLSGVGLNKAVKKAVPFDVCDLHGWRSTFVTMGIGYGWPHSLVVQTISHSKPGTAADHAYDRARYTELKKAIVQWYADYLDALRDCMTIPAVDLKGGALFGI